MDAGLIAFARGDLTRAQQVRLTSLRTSFDVTLLVSRFRSGASHTSPTSILHSFSKTWSLQNNVGAVRASSASTSQVSPRSSFALLASPILSLVIVDPPSTRPLSRRSPSTPPSLPCCSLPSSSTSPLVLIPPVARLFTSCMRLNPHLPCSPQEAQPLIPPPLPAAPRASFSGRSESCFILRW